MDRQRMSVRWLAISLLTATVLALPGCALVPLAQRTTPREAPAKYSLANKSCVVLVWVDRPLQIEDPNLRFDIIKYLQHELSTNADGKPRKDTTWGSYPHPASDIETYLRNTPEVLDRPILDVAPIFKAQRVIYIELYDFGTRSETTVQLFRGRARANLKVIEVADGKAKLGYSEPDIEVYYPNDIPPEGTPNGSDAMIRANTIRAFGVEVANRFRKHELAPLDAGDEE